MSTPNTQLGFYKEDVSLAIQRLNDLEDVMTKFGISSRELELLMTNEYHHFAVRVEGENRLRLFTAHCVFSVDLNSNRCAVHVSDTVWMHALIEARKAQDALSDQLAASQRECASEWSRRVEAETRCTELRGGIVAMSSKVVDLEKRLKSWQSRYFKQISKLRRTKPTAKRHRSSKKAKP